MWKLNKINKITIIICLFILVAVVVYLLLPHKQPIAPPVLVPTPTVLKPIKTINRSNNPFSSFEKISPAATYSFAAIPSDSPINSVPLYIVSKQENLLKNLIQNASALFGFTTTPKAVTMSRGIFSLWNEENKSLSAGGDPVEIGYYGGLALSNKIIPGNLSGLESKAKEYIQKFKIIPPGATLSSPTVEFSTPIGNDPISTTQARATRVTFRFRATIDNLPVYTGSPENYFCSAIFDADGNLVSFSAIVLNNVVRGSSYRQIISPAEAADRLIAGDGVVVSAYSEADKNRLSSFDYSVFSASLGAPQLAYFYDASKNDLLPIYVFRGKGNDIKSGSNLFLTLFVSALKVN